MYGFVMTVTGGAVGSIMSSTSVYSYLTKQRRKNTVDKLEHFSFVIVKIPRCWQKLASEKMEKYGLRGPRATYLTTIYRYLDGITVPPLCQRNGKDKPDASRMTVLLEEKDFVAKQGVDKSLYRDLLVLTQKGIAAAEQVRKKASCAIEIVGKDLTEKMRTVFTNCSILSPQA